MFEKISSYWNYGSEIKHANASSGSLKEVFGIDSEEQSRMDRFNRFKSLSQLRTGIENITTIHQK